MKELIYIQEKDFLKKTHFNCQTRKYIQLLRRNLQDFLVQTNLLQKSNYWSWKTIWQESFRTNVRNLFQIILISNNWSHYLLLILQQSLQQMKWMKVKYFCIIIVTIITITVTIIIIDDNIDELTYFIFIENNLYYI